jgi:hypothetical protein
VFLALALFSTGPVERLMPIFAATALVLALIALWFQFFGRVPNKFRVSNIVLCALALGLVLIDAAEPRGFEPYAMHFRGGAQSGASLGTPQSRFDAALDRMALTGQVAALGYIAAGPGIVAVGTQSVNRDVNPENPSFPISSLAHPDRLTEIKAAGTFIAYDHANYPRDPYARDIDACFGVYVTRRHLLVYSPGPDGVWQINPRIPVDPDTVDPLSTLGANIYPEELEGALAPGDIVRVLPLEDQSLRWVTAGELRDRVKRQSGL